MNGLLKKIEKHDSFTYNEQQPLIVLFLKFNLFLDVRIQV